MITVVTLNPAVDKTYRVSALRPGRIHRVDQVDAFPGGKGINVAKVLKRLGLAVQVTGFIGGGTGDAILQGLDQLGLSHRMVPIPGETRTCLNILDETGRTQTEFLEPGPSVPKEKWEALKGTVGRLAEESRVVVFSGSLPGLDDDAYRELVFIAQARRSKAVVDTGGAPPCPGPVGPPLCGEAQRSGDGVPVSKGGDERFGANRPPSGMESKGDSLRLRHAGGEGGPGFSGRTRPPGASAGDRGGQPGDAGMPSPRDWRRESIGKRKSKTSWPWPPQPPRPTPCISRPERWMRIK